MSSNNPHDRESDGGPAFPIHGRDRLVSDDWEGMSLRDWFAGQALIGLLANPGPLMDQHGNLVAREAPTTAQFAYQFADAMLKRRTL